MSTQETPKIRRSKSLAPSRPKKVKLFTTEPDLDEQLSQSLFPDMDTQPIIADLDNSMSQFPDAQTDNSLIWQEAQPWEIPSAQPDSGFGHDENVPSVKPTLSQVSVYYSPIHQVEANFNRIVLVTNDPRNTTYSQVMLFKPMAPDYFMQRIQMISLNNNEFERVFLQLGSFLEEGVKLAAGTPMAALPQADGRKVSDVQDEEHSHWFLDVTTNKNRKVRVALVVFDWRQPSVSTYFRLKLFKTSLDGLFYRESQVTITLQELEALASNAKNTLADIKKHTA